MIHPTAIVHPDAQVHPSVRIDPFAIVGEHVKIGRDTIVNAHAIIEGDTVIGERNRIFPGAAIGLVPQDLKYNGALSQVRIGDDNCIREYVTINRATYDGEVTRIGNGNLLMAYVHVAHNCVIGDHTVIANAVSLAGHVTIEDNVTIGGMAGLHQFVRVGTLAMIGGKSRVVRDVSPYTLVEGSPCYARALNQVGLRRSGMNSDTRAAIKQAFRILYRSGLRMEEALAKIATLPPSPEVERLHAFVDASLQGKRKLTPGTRSRTIHRDSSHDD
jgi:UDP-N-acetylglucosamine acyltransferase